MMKTPHVLPAVYALLLVLLAPAASMVLQGRTTAVISNSTETSLERSTGEQSFTNSSTARVALDTPGDEWKLRIHPVVSLATIQSYAQGQLTPGFVAADAQFAIDRANAQATLAAINAQLATNSKQVASATKQAASKNDATAAKGEQKLTDLSTTTDSLNTRQDAAEKALAKLSTKPTVKQWGCLVQLWDHESGWDVYAKNPKGGAYGIPQSLPANKMSAQGSDWQYNYKTQIDWGLQYISDRYQTPCNAWKLWQQNDPHWY